MRCRSVPKWNLALLAALLTASGCAGGLERGRGPASARRGPSSLSSWTPAAKDNLTHCRQAGRAVSGPATFWDVGLEIRRVADTQPLLVEPPAEDLRAVDVEVDCKTGRLIRRKSMDELIADSVGLVLAPFASR